MTPSVRRSRSKQALFTPYRMGDLVLLNRIVMAPLTRMRARSHDLLRAGLPAHSTGNRYFERVSVRGLILSRSPDRLIEHRLRHGACSGHGDVAGVNVSRHHRAVVEQPEL
jgi:hypothetical protein